MQSVRLLCQAGLLAGKVGNCLKVPRSSGSLKVYSLCAYNFRDLNGEVKVMFTFTVSHQKCVSLKSARPLESISLHF